MPDLDAPLTKRLHISGLTPALTPDDLSARLSTFGTVKAVDGFGLRDGLDQPRKFGYVTLETTTGKLARCLNLLSGSTWKGAKLRIGEAKLDFAERLAKERQAAIDEPPRKRQKRSGGVHAEDMTFVTPENVADRSGWKVTPMGRVVRPVRMRPDRPLLPMDEDRSKKKPVKTKPLKKRTGDDKDGEVKKRKRVKEPDVRARRRTIDVTRWPSVHLKGMFLDMDVVGTKVDDRPVSGATTVVEESDSDDDSEAPEEAEEIEDVPFPVPSARSPSLPRQIPTVPVSTSKSTITILPDDNTDIDLEKTQSLNLLASLFGGKDEADWVGRESVGSDVDEVELAKGQVMILDDDDGDIGFEIVPLESSRPAPADVGEDGHDMEVEADAVDLQDPPPSLKQQQSTKLKDLFAPREEEAGFSLLGHLDLDLELDDEVPFSTTQPTHPGRDDTSTPLIPTPYIHTHIPTPTPTHSTPLQLNPKHPLFFPLPRSSTQPAKPSNKAHPPDPFEVAKERGWGWRDPGVGFFRTGTEEEVRTAWEEEKAELTRGWKKRCREAGKVGRRRGRGAGAGDLGE